MHKYMENGKKWTLNLLKLLVFAAILCIVYYGSVAIDRMKDYSGETGAKNIWTTNDTGETANYTNSLTSYQINVMNMLISFLVAVATTLLIIAAGK